MRRGWSGEAAREDRLADCEKSTSSEAATHESLGAVGFCREAATDHSPGLQPWVTRSQNTP
jgi:hypothetical protein